MKTNGITFGMLAVFGGLALGCASYHVGPNKRIAGARSVEVKFFKDETFVPRLATAVNRAMKSEFQDDGTYSLETQSEGDLVVTGRLTNFRRNGVSYKPDDVLTVQDYTMELTAEIKVYKRGNPDPIFRETIIGTAVVPARNDLTAGQRQAVPIIAAKLAEQAVLQIVDRDWVVADKPAEAPPEAPSEAPPETP
jgi:hypothetical protein